MFLFLLALNMSSEKINVFFLLSHVKRIKRTILPENNLLPHRLSPQVSQGSPVLLCSPKKKINSASHAIILSSFRIKKISLLRTVGHIIKTESETNKRYLQMVLHHFSKTFLYKVVHFKMGFSFFHTE